MININDYYTPKGYLKTNLSPSQITLLQESTSFFKEVQSPPRRKNLNTSIRLEIIKHQLTEETILCDNKDCTNQKYFDYLKTKHFKKYCVHCSKKSKESIIKRKETIQDKYNVDNISQLDTIKKKKEQTCLSHYNETNPSKVQKFKKYGKSNNLSSFKSRQKIQNTNKNKYKVNHYSEQTIQNYEYWDDSEFIKTSFFKNDIFNYLEFKTFFNCSNSTAFKRIKTLDIKYSKQSNSKSLKEEIISEMFKEVTEVISNNRDLINPYEIDIFLPHYNIGIEYNGSYWHSTHKEDSLKQKYQHHKKTMLCQDKGIRLIHIYEDYNEEKTISTIFNILSNPDLIIFDNNEIDLNYGLPNSIELHNPSYSDPYIIKVNNFIIYDAGRIISKK